MLVKLPSTSNSFFTPFGEFINQSQLRIVVSCVALAILCAGTLFWICSHFWQNRRVQKKESDDLLDVSSSHFSKKSDRYEDFPFESGEVSVKDKWDSEWSKYSSQKKFPGEEAFKNDKSKHESGEKFKVSSTPKKPSNPKLSPSQDRLSPEQFDDIPAIESGDFDESEIDEYLQELLFSMQNPTS